MPHELQPLLREPHHARTRQIPPALSIQQGQIAGRDGIVGTADDVVLLDALNQMAANKIILYEFHTYDAGELWDFWTGITGGGVYITGSSGSDLINQIVAAVEATTKSFDTLTLNASAGFEAWLASVEPPQYSSIEVPEEGISFDFDISVCVPAGACVEGINTFTINALGDGLTLAQQNVTINTVCEIKVPVDIKPGSCPNPIRLKETGVMPFAIMGTVDFDVAQIDPASIRLSREGTPGEVAPLRWSCYDAGIPNEEFDPTLCNCVGYGYDGIIDLALKFDVQSVTKTLRLAEVAGQTIPITMTGKLKAEFGGTPITGQDCVWVLRK